MKKKIYWVYKVNLARGKKRAHILVDRKYRKKTARAYHDAPAYRVTSQRKVKIGRLKHFFHYY